MADKILRWYFSGQVRPLTRVDGIHTLETDYRPEKVVMNFGDSPDGNAPTVIDIKDDGVSIFADDKAASTQASKTWTTMPGNTMYEDSIISMDVYSVGQEFPGSDLTVELYLNAV